MTMEEALDELKWADWPADAEMFRHVKTGKRYYVSGRALREADLKPMVLYTTLSLPRITWARPRDEFMDGRFERC